MTYTRKNLRSGRGSATRGWKNEKPGYHQRTTMMKRCGKNVFWVQINHSLFAKNTCKVSSKGVYAAYIRARQYRTRGKNTEIFQKKQIKCSLKWVQNNKYILVILVILFINVTIKHVIKVFIGIFTID